VSQEAKRRFSVGVALLRDPSGPRYEEAYREFSLAYAASHSPRILGNLGLCAMKLERDAEAITAFETYLRSARDVGAEERESIERDLGTLQAGIVRVTVSSNPPGAILDDTRIPVQEARVVNTYGPVSAPMELGIRRGRHTLVAKLAGYPDQRWDFDANGGTLEAHVFRFKTPAAQAVAAAPDQVRSTVGPTSPTGIWVAGALTVALGTAGAIMGVHSLMVHDSYDEQNEAHNVDAARSLRTQGLEWNVATDITLGAAVVAAGVTVVMVLTRPAESRRNAALSLTSQGNAQGRALAAVWTF
jgi:hypothetical protein